MLCDGKAVSAGHGACQEDWKIPRWEAQSKKLFRWQQCGELEAYSDADWERRHSHSTIGFSRSHHEWRALTKKQQVVSLSTGESELYAAVATASEGLGIQSVAKDLGMSCGLNLHLDASATMCLVSRRGLGKAKHVDVQNQWIQEASKSGRFVTKNVGKSMNPADLMTKPVAETESRATHEPHGLRVHEGRSGCAEGSIDEIMMGTHQGQCCKRCAERRWSLAAVRRSLSAGACTCGGVCVMNEVWHEHVQCCSVWKQRDYFVNCEGSCRQWGEWNWRKFL